MTLANGVEEGGEVANVDVGGFRKLSRPGDKFRLAHIKGPVGAERRKDTSRQVRLRDRLMVAQIVDRIIGRADHLHVKFLENFVGRSSSARAAFARSQIFGAEFSSSRSLIPK